jgi:hypothetical protein
VWLTRIISVLAAFLFVAALNPQTLPRSIHLRAKDGVAISGLVYEAKQPKAVVLLFHQAASSKAEYATIAPRLANAGFTALAIDQRSGGSLYGPNETAARLTTEPTYEETKSDFVARPVHRLESSPKSGIFSGDQHRLQPRRPDCCGMRRLRFKTMFSMP